MKKEKHINVAFEADTHERLKALAKEDKRPVSNLVRHIVKLYIRDVDDGSVQLSIYTRLRRPREVPCYDEVNKNAK